MKKLMILIIVLLLLLLLGVGRFLYPGKVAVLDGVVNPFIKMEVDDNQLYIADGAAIHIYSLKDYNLKKKFGRKGEGPQEFKVEPTINMGSVILEVYPDYLLVNSLGKISFFTKQGEFIKEIRSVSPIGCFKVMGDRFVGYGYTAGNKTHYITVNIYDSTLNVVRELYREPQWINPGKDIDVFGSRSAFFFVSDDKILVENRKSSIVVFNGNGEKLYSIDPQIKPLKVTEKAKKRGHDYFKSLPQFKQLYAVLNFKDRLKFPRYFPNIRFFSVADHKIYVLSWRREENKSECFIYDLEGNLINKTYLPLEEDNILIPYPFTIGNGKFYQLVENEDDEAWELHISNIAE
jgi:hypothetical protein